MKPIGATFFAELQVAGLVGLPFSWGDDGSFCFGEKMTDDQRAAVLAVYAAHDPTKQSAPPPPSETAQLAQLLQAKGILTTADAATFSQDAAPEPVTVVPSATAA